MALQQSDEPFRLLVESVRDYAIFMLDPQGHIATWNAGAERIKGYPADEIIGKHFSIFYPPDQRPTAEEKLRRAAADGRYQEEAWRVRKDGTTFWADVVITALRDPGGRLVGFAKVTRDLTERRIAEMARARLVEERAAHRATERARERNALLADVSARLVHSLEPTETARLLAESLVPRLAEWCVVDLVASNGSMSRAAVVHPDQEIRAHLAALAPPAPPSDPPSLSIPLVARERVLGVLSLGPPTAGSFDSDATSLSEEVGRRAALALDNARLFVEMQEARSAAERAVRERDEFLSAAAHELKTPVTSLWGFAQLLLRQLGKTDAVSPKRWEHGLRALEKQAVRLAALVDELLDVSRIELGRLPLRPLPTNLAPLVEEVVDTMRQSAPGRRFRLETVPAAANVDPVRLEQVLVNVLDNALKFTPGDTPIDITVGEQDGSVTVTIRDYGSGVADEHREHVFDRYYQARPHVHVDGRTGLGLGLYISREIVERHGGTIAVEGPPGGGASFTIRLPALERNRDAPAS